MEPKNMIHSLELQIISFEHDISKKIDLLDEARRKVKRLKKQLSEKSPNTNSQHTCLGENKDLSLDEGSIPSADTLSKSKKEVK